MWLLCSEPDLHYINVTCKITVNLVFVKLLAFCLIKWFYKFVNNINYVSSYNNEKISIIVCDK